MGQRYEKSKKNVSENKKTLERLHSDKDTLQNEYTPLSLLDSIQGLLDDEATDAIQGVRAVGEIESQRIDSETETAEEEKKQITGEINNEIAKLNAGLEKLHQAEGIEFGKSAVAGAKQEYKRQIDKFNKLLGELGIESGAATASDRRTAGSAIVNDSSNETNDINDSRSDLRSELQEKASVVQAPNNLKLSALNYSSAFISSDKELKNTERLASYVNAIEGSDKRVVNLYNSIGRIEYLHEKGIAFSITHNSNHYVGRSGTENNGRLEVSSIELSIPELSGENITGQVQTTLHEQMHLIDYLLKDDVKDYEAPWFTASSSEMVETLGSSTCEMGSQIQDLFRQHDQGVLMLQDELRQEYRNKIEDAKRQFAENHDPAAFNEAISKAREELNTQFDYGSRNLMGGGVGQLEDIYDALSSGQFRDSGKVLFGHGSNYYNTDETKIDEIIANYASLSVTRPDLVNLLRQDKPQLVSTLDFIIDSMNERIMRR